MAFFILTLTIALLSWVLPSLQICKTFPGDLAWPSPDVWDSLNATVDGRLIRTIPIGTPCHNPTLNPEQCTNVQENWHSPAFHEQSSSSVQTPFFANKSCDPFTGPNAQCVIGTYVQYAVNVSTPAHVITTLQFAKLHNIRFVVRNTGHDYMGKSTGAGGLSIWTLHLKETEWIDDYTLSSFYKGAAVKVQAGVSVLQMYEEADARGYAIVGGDCPTVGFAGGYFQGGGHSALSSLYGMAADQTLSMEVITTGGQFVTASPTQNSDLYWALSGGGGGTYGVVWTVTFKAHPDTQVSGAIISFSTGPTVSLDTWWEGVNFYQASSPTYTDVGAVVFALYSQGSFQLHPLFLPNGTTEDVSRLIQPFLAKLESLSIPYNSSVTTYTGFLPAYNNLFPQAFFSVGVSQFGGRLLPRSLWESEASLTMLTGIIRNIIDDGASAFDVALRPTLEVAGNPNNAVLPAWRTAERHFIPSLPWNDTADWTTVFEQRHEITWVYDEALRQITPGGGAYLNEADSSEPDWQQAFYGSNYAKLLAIKDKWDPDQSLYGATAVGGDRWVERSDGRLCSV